MKKVSAFKIVMMGQFIVNIPVIILILLIIFVFIYFGFGMSLGTIIGSSIGWILWEKLLLIWKRWALSKGVEKERLFKLGKIGLINFYRSRIFDEKYD